MREVRVRLKLWGLVLSLAAGAAMVPTLARAQLPEDKFDIAEPASVGSLRKLTLYSTYYYVLSADHVADGNKLLDKTGKDLGAALGRKEWCAAAVEGTVAVGFKAPARTETFNYTGVASDTQVDCAPLYPSMSSGPRNKMGKSRWQDLGAKAPLGLGDQANFRLVPYRSIAVDRAQSHFAKARNAVIFVPGLRGVKLKMPDGSERVHDGYLFAADTGGAIKTNHIDFFTGVSEKNPAPGLIKSTPSGTFPAYIVTDEAIRAKLLKMHVIE